MLYILGRPDGDKYNKSKKPDYLSRSQMASSGIIELYGSFILCNAKPAYTYTEEHAILRYTKRQSYVDPGDLLYLESVAKPEIMKSYDICLENAPHMKSIPKHWHVHFIKVKDASSFIFG